MATTDVYPGHYAENLVTWRATLLGALVAFVLGVMFNILGAALGIAVLTAGSAGGAGILSVIWLVVANLLALGIGAWFAARISATPDYHNGALQGMAVWAVTTALTVVLATTAISNLLGTVTNTVTGAAGAATNAVQQNTTTQQVQGAAQDLAANASDIAASAQQAIQENQGAIAQAADTAGTATATGTLGVFGAMLLGLLAAIIGARMGAKHPNWDTRPRYTGASRVRETY